MTKKIVRNEHFPKNTVGGLFVERTFHRGKTFYGDRSKYTLKNDDYEYMGKTYQSLYKLYMDMEDTTEYIFATTYIGTWQDWNSLLSCKWFKPYIERWRQELTLKLEARHLQKLRDTADGEGRDSVLASKYLLEKAKQNAKADTPQRGRGRPSNKPVLSQERPTSLVMDLKILEAMNGPANRDGPNNSKNTGGDGERSGDVHSNTPSKPSTGTSSQ